MNRIISLLHLLYLPLAFGALTLRPSDTTVLVGDTVTLQCSTDLSEPVSWTRKRDGQVYAEDVYHGSGVITMEFQDRFSVNRSSGSYTLIIRNVTWEDEAVYICIDDAGFGRDTGEYGSAKLTVTERPTVGHTVPVDAHSPRVLTWSSVDAVSTAATGNDSGKQSGDDTDVSSFIIIIIAIPAIAILLVALVIYFFCCRRHNRAGCIKIICSSGQKSENCAVEIESGELGSSRSSAPLVLIRESPEHCVKSDMGSLTMHYSKLTEECTESKKLLEQNQETKNSELTLAQTCVMTDVTEEGKPDEQALDLFRHSLSDIGINGRNKSRNESASQDLCKTGASSTQLPQEVSHNHEHTIDKEKDISSPKISFYNDKVNGTKIQDNSGQLRKLPIILRTHIHDTVRQYLPKNKNIAVDSEKSICKAQGSDDNMKPCSKGHNDDNNDNDNDDDVVCINNVDDTIGVGDNTEDLSISSVLQLITEILESGSKIVITSRQEASFLKVSADNVDKALDYLVSEVLKKGYKLGSEDANECELDNYNCVCSRICTIICTSSRIKGLRHLNQKIRNIRYAEYVSHQNQDLCLTALTFVTYLCVQPELMSERESETRLLAMFYYLTKECIKFDTLDASRGIVSCFSKVVSAYQCNGRKPPEVYQDIMSLFQRAAVDTGIKNREAYGRLSRMVIGLTADDNSV